MLVGRKTILGDRWRSTHNNTYVKEHFLVILKPLSQYNPTKSHYTLRQRYFPATEYL